MALMTFSGKVIRPSLDLAAVLDRSIFIAKCSSTPALHELPSIRSISSIPMITTEEIEPSTPARPQDGKTESLPKRHGSLSPPSAAASPTRPEQVENVYDRFLMATSGVTRVGKGYQSANTINGHIVQAAQARKRQTGLFHSTRRHMPPPVCSDDLMDISVDEVGLLRSLPSGRTNTKPDGHSTVRIMKNALKAIVTVRPTSRRPSGIP